MSRVPNLGPGEDPTHATLHGLIAHARKTTLTHGPVATVQESRSGTRVTPTVPPGPIMAYLKGHHDDEGFEKYEWEEAINDGVEWLLKERGLSSNEKHADYSPIADYADGDPGPEPEKVLLSPAVEVNHITGIPERTLVKIYPGQRYYNTDKKCWVKPYWFSLQPEVQPFEVIEDLIPCRYEDGDGGNPEFVPTCRLKVRLLTEPLPRLEEEDLTPEEEEKEKKKREVWVYPPSEHFVLDESVEEDEDWDRAVREDKLPAIAVGIARDGTNSTYFDGTYGWCVWKENLWEEKVEGGEDNEYDWISGYQIVSMFGQLEAECEVFDIDAEADDYVVQDGQSGTAKLRWMNINPSDGHIVDSGYEIQVWNKTGHDVYGGVKYKIYFYQQYQQWQIRPHDTRRYFKGTDDWEEEFPGAMVCWILGKICNNNGIILNEEELKFFCYRPRISNCNDPSLYEHDVLPWGYDSEGRREVLGDYLWSKVGDIKMVVSIADILTGWRECDGEEGTVDFTGKDGRFAKHKVSDAVGDQDGYQWHGPEENNHRDHSNHLHIVASEESTFIHTDNTGVFHCWNADLVTKTSGVSGPTVPDNGSDYLNHLGPGTPGDPPTDCDNRPPYTTVIFIERYK